MRFDATRRKSASVSQSLSLTPLRTRLGFSAETLASAALVSHCAKCQMEIPHE
jgi:hypothetical protein